MADFNIDPYAGVESEAERQAIYQGLLKKYDEDLARTESLNQQIYKPLREDWEHYRAVQLKQDEKFLRNVIMLSAGAFGVSFAFIDRLVPFQTASYKPVLVAAWGLFAGTLVLAVFCHILSSFIHGKYCDDIVREVDERNAGRPYKRMRRWYFGWVSSLLEWLSFGGFLGGMTCLVCFVLLNI